MSSLRGDSNVLYANRPLVANPQNSQTCLPAVDMVQVFAGLPNAHYTFNALQDTNAENQELASNFALQTPSHARF